MEEDWEYWKFQFCNQYSKEICLEFSRLPPHFTTDWVEFKDCCSCYSEVDGGGTFTKTSSPKKALEPPILQHLIFSPKSRTDVAKCKIKTFTFWKKYQIPKIKLSHYTTFKPPGSSFKLEAPIFNPSNHLKPDFTLSLGKVAVNSQPYFSSKSDFESQQQEQGVVIPKKSKNPIKEPITKSTPSLEIPITFNYKSNDRLEFLANIPPAPDFPVPKGCIFEGGTINSFLPSSIKNTFGPLWPSKDVRSLFKYPKTSISRPKYSLPIGNKVLPHHHQESPPSLEPTLLLLLEDCCSLEKEVDNTLESLGQSDGEGPILGMKPIEVIVNRKFLELQDLLRVFDSGDHHPPCSIIEREFCEDFPMVAASPDHAILILDDSLTFKGGESLILNCLEHAFSLFVQISMLIVSQGEDSLNQTY